MSPTVSVVTVCRNSVRTIEHCVASVAAQHGVDIEHVVVDGASTDGTQEVAAAHLRAGGRIVSEPDKGIYDAMNKGWRLARGDYVAFLNADDHYSDPNVLARLAGTARTRDVDVVLGDVRLFDPARPHRFVRRYRSGLFRPFLLRFGLMPAHPGMLMRRSLLERLGGFRQDMAIAADYDLCVRAFWKARCSWAHVPIAAVDMATGGASTRDLRAKLLINTEVLHACLDNGLYTNRALIMMKYPLKALDLINVR